MAHEENPDGAGVEIQTQAPDHPQPHVVDAVAVDAVAVEAVVGPAPAAAVAPAAVPDFYAVGVRLIKMSPVWLLTLTGGFALLLLALSWVRPAGGDVDAASIPNDAKAVVVQYPEVPAQAAKPNVETPAVPAKNEHAETAAETKAAEQVQPVTPAPAQQNEVKPVEPKKEPVKQATPASDADGKFTVQVGSFNVESQANERISSLRAAGFDARSTVVQIPGRGTWYRVQVGRFRERDTASKTAAQLREKGAAASSMVVAVE